jgi:hypothetical protein
LKENTRGDWQCGDGLSDNSPEAANGFANGTL